jgi:hypothetical protein
MLWLQRRIGLFQQRDERFLQNIFRFRMAQPQRATIKDQLRGFRRVKRLTPIGMCVIIHGFIA